jgi:hypothetical protein
MKQLPVASTQLPVKAETQSEDDAAFAFCCLAKRIVAGRGGCLPLRLSGVLGARLSMSVNACLRQQSATISTHSCTSRYFAMKKNVLRAMIEVAFIIFLFYSNLLMGEFERAGMGQKRGVAWAVRDVFTTANFEIAVVAAFIGYGLVEFLRKRF